MTLRQQPNPPLASPCIGICAVSARAGFCIGCGRKLAEIGGWRGLSDAEKQDVLDALPARLAAMQTDNQTG